MTVLLRFTNSPITNLCDCGASVRYIPILLILFLSLPAHAGNTPTIAAAKRAMAKELKDPASTKYRNVFIHKSKEGHVTVCGEINSKNGYGGYSGWHKFMYSDNEVWMIPTEDEAGSSTLWKRSIGGLYQTFCID